MSSATTRIGIGRALHVALAASAALGALAALAPVAAAQTGKSRIDRRAVPTPAAIPALRVPAWKEEMLPSGARLVVVERRTLPLVSFSISFLGGAHQFEPADKRGVANFTAAMLSEGTTTRTGDQLSDALALLGTGISAGIGGETGSIGFTTLSNRFGRTLDLLADMMLNPVFPADALERMRARTLVSLTQARDQPTVIASNVFQRTLYGTEHPYGRVQTEASTKAITREDIAAFHRAYFRPGRATITVVGDVDLATAKREIQRALAAWPAGGAPVAFDYPRPPAPRPASIYLVDKPGAAQSSFAIGLPGPTRATPDYYALQVFNTILGGAFQSRLNANIREQKGYSYGVNSGFGYGRGPGAFSAGGEIVTAKSDSALLEFMKELRGAQGAIPFSDEEIATAKATLIQRLPSQFASASAVSGAITSLYLLDLPKTYYQDYAAKVRAVTREDLLRVARQHVPLEQLNIVIVGDRKAIERALADTRVAPIQILDIDGNPVLTP